MNLWDSPLNTAKTLSDNATCILFGPVAELRNDKLCKAAVQHLMKTIHVFYIKDDVVPKLSHRLTFENAVYGVCQLNLFQTIIIILSQFIICIVYCHIGYKYL